MVVEIMMMMVMTIKEDDCRPGTFHLRGRCQVSHISLCLAL